MHAKSSHKWTKTTRRDKYPPLSLESLCKLGLFRTEITRDTTTKVWCCIQRSKSWAKDKREGYVKKIEEAEKNLQRAFEANIEVRKVEDQFMEGLLNYNDVWKVEEVEMESVTFDYFNSLVFL